MSSSHSAPLRVRLRPDLVAVPVDAPRGRHWHVKDPLSLRFFRFDAREWFLLQRLEEQPTFDQLLAAHNRQFAPWHLSARQLLFFLDEARRNGLLICDASVWADAEGDEGARRKQFSRWLARLGKWNVLSIRLPGLDPDRWLDAAYPLVAWMFSRCVLGLSGVILLAATLLVLVRFDEFVDRLPDRTAFFTPQTALWLAAALAISKVLHELAHAFACKHFGGECHELGVLLLVFVPCLYCNVSDSWLLARRRERMCITAAGMWMELLLAAGATFVWWLADDGPLRMGALSLMLVCSVNTLLLNGNPLMRYDGYYLLSDLVRVPNLSAEAARVAAETWRRWGLGLSDASPPRPGEPRGWLLGYAVASFLYRLFLAGAILLGVHALGRAFRLQVLAWIISLLTLTNLVSPLVIVAARPLLRRAERRRVSPSHALGTLLVLAAVAGGLLVIPLPYHLYAPFVIEADEAERVVATVPGRLVEALPVGSRVAPGDVVARLENPPLSLRLAMLQARKSLLEQQLAGYLAVRGEHEETAVRIPATREAIADLEQQIRTLAAQLGRLELRATRAGTILSPPNVPRLPAEPDELPLWDGSPLEAANLGCYLETGAPVCLVGNPSRVSATVLVSQAELPFVRHGQRVDLLLSGLSDRTLPGVVAEVSPVPVDVLPRELAARRALPTDPNSPQNPRPLEPIYRVRVTLDESGVAPPLRWATGEARIRLASEPLAYRLWRSARRTFHFQL